MKWLRGTDFERGPYFGDPVMVNKTASTKVVESLVSKR